MPTLSLPERCRVRFRRGKTAQSVAAAIIHIPGCQTTEDRSPSARSLRISRFGRAESTLTHVSGANDRSGSKPNPSGSVPASGATSEDLGCNAPGSSETAGSTNNLWPSTDRTPGLVGVSTVTQGAMWAAASSIGVNFPNDPASMAVLDTDEIGSPFGVGNRDEEGAGSSASCSTIKALSSGVVPRVNEVAPRIFVSSAWTGLPPGPAVTKGPTGWVDGVETSKGWF